MSEPTAPASALDIPAILRILPHRHPFVMVDRVTELVPPTIARGRKCVAYGEPWFQGHFPERPVVPGVLLLESFAQLGGILAHASRTSDESEGERLMFILGIDKAKFRRPVIPGDVLDIEVERLHERAGVWRFRGEAKVDGAKVAEAELLASLVLGS